MTKLAKDLELWEPRLPNDQHRYTQDWTNPRTLLLVEQTWWKTDSIQGWREAFFYHAFGKKMQ